MGKVFLVGAGPGDPDLLTVKALRILERAEVVVYDRLVSADVLSLAAQAILIDGGKQRGEQNRIQEAAETFKPSGHLRTMPTTFVEFADAVKPVGVSTAISIVPLRDAVKSASA